MVKLKFRFTFPIFELPKVFIYDPHIAIPYLEENRRENSMQAFARALRPRACTFMILKKCLPIKISDAKVAK